jgi:glutathione S-transferase
MAVELYLLSGSPYAWRVQLALEHKGIPYVTRMLSLSAGDLRAPDYLALNPRGRVPTLVDGDVVLYESMAILAYLEARSPTPALFGATPREIGATWRVISEYTSYADPAVEAFILPIYFGRAAEQAAEIRAAVATLAAELARWEETLARTPYLAGDALSAADFVVYPAVQSILRAAGKDAARAFDLPFLPFAGTHPAIDAWRQRIEALPYHARTWPPHWR